MRCDAHGASLERLRIYASCKFISQRLPTRINTTAWPLLSKLVTKLLSPNEIHSSTIYHPAAGRVHVQTARGETERSEVGVCMGVCERER